MLRCDSTALARHRLSKNKLDDRHAETCGFTEVAYEIREQLTRLWISRTSTQFASSVQDLTMGLAIIGTVRMARRDALAVTRARRRSSRSAEAGKLPRLVEAFAGNRRTSCPTQGDPCSARQRSPQLHSSSCWRIRPDIRGPEKDRMLLRWMIDELEAAIAPAAMIWVSAALGRVGRASRYSGNCRSPAGDPTMQHRKPTLRPDHALRLHDPTDRALSYSHSRGDFWNCSDDRIDQNDFAKMGRLPWRW